MRTITLEEHYAMPGFFDGPGRELKNRADRVGGRYANLIERLCDIEICRLSFLRGRNARQRQRDKKCKRGHAEDPQHHSPPVNSRGYFFVNYILRQL